MSATLRIADEKNAYVIVDRGTYLANKKWLRLKIMVAGDEALFNPYGVMAVNPNKHSAIKYDLATDFISWLTSQECQKMINEFKIEEETLFTGHARK